MAERITSTQEAPGERLDYTSDEATPEVVHRHLERYWKAMERLIWLKVYGQQLILDYGCGNGYGTAMLNALGIVYSYDPKVPGPRPRWYKHAGIDTNGFDAIVCIEVYEHMTAVEQRDFLGNCVDKWLKPSGVLYMTTPLGDDGPNPLNPHHLCEPRLDTLRSDIDARFDSWKLWWDDYHSTYGPVTQATVLAFNK